MQENNTEESKKLRERKENKGEIRAQENNIEQCNLTKQNSTKNLWRRTQVNDAEE